MKSTMKVVKLDKKTCDLFVSNKHYSRKPSIFWCCFGLVENERITGVVVYGQPSPAIQKHAFKDRDFRLYELSRLVIQSKTKNAGSYLVGNSLKMLPEQPCAVVSYADLQYGHCGIIYQSTNWLYTGKTKSHDKLYIVDGQKVHPMTLRDRGITDPMRWAKENNIETVLPDFKHRYFYLVGNKYQKKDMLSKLQYNVIFDYPKVQKSMYDDGEELYVPYLDSN